MIRHIVLSLALAVVLAGCPTASANTPVEVSLTCEGIHREFARRQLSQWLLGHRRGTWNEIDEFFTDESREALSALTERQVPPTTAVDELVLFEARISLIERLRITNQDATWDTVCAVHLEQIRSREGEAYEYFLNMFLFAELARFWWERIERLFPLAADDYVPLRPDDDTI